MAGMDDCLVKSFDLAQLLKKLDRWLPILREVPKAAQAPSPGAAQPMSEALDLSLIAATWGEGNANLREALSAFRRSNEDDSTALRRAISAGDITGITTAAHRMLGASKMVGAQAFADVCERIDAASRASDWTALTTALQDFNEESARLDADLEQFGKQEILE